MNLSVSSWVHMVRGVEQGFALPLPLPPGTELAGSTMPLTERVPPNERDLVDLDSSELSVLGIRIEGMGGTPSSEC